MKSLALACLLAIAATNALPQSEIVPAQNRIVDYWLIDAIEILTQWIKNKGLDPVETDIELDYVSRDGLLQIVGLIEGLQFKGISDINIDNLYYNIILGRLDIDLVIPKVWFHIGNSRIKAVYAGLKADLEINGSLIFFNIRIAGDALLRLFGGSVTILNMNPNFSIEHIDAGWTLLESGEDYSCWINNIFNTEIPNFLETYKNEINTVIGEQIRRAVNRWW
ncbi:uncharacterized protein LOC123864514 [Maniola jurtina]|uniref:uncharacterized protein LOC123864514 n=1 Tax=Maniola jurtina TaxID=191418 RepID=UPI001E68CF95|nr:uncharacterized protein LOC123864514 [Maniola jurtina]